MNTEYKSCECEEEATVAHVLDDKSVLSIPIFTCLACEKPLPEGYVRVNPLPWNSCPHCCHEIKQHRVDQGWGEPKYQCWERDHPYCGGRCGCRYKPPETFPPKVSTT